MEKMHKGFRAMSNKMARPKTSQLIGAFDIETEGLGGRYLDGFTYVDGEEPMRHNSMKSVLSELMTRADVRWYAHNASGYEFSYIVELLQREGLDIPITATVQGESRIIGLRMDVGDSIKLELRDSLALLPMSLDDASKKFSKQHQKQAGAIDWQHETYDPTNTVHVEYAKQDVLALVDVVKGFASLIDQAFGVGITMSAASTALNCWYNTLEGGEKYYRSKSRVMEELHRNAYYGGFVFPGKSIEKQKDIISIDRNAAYAAAMSCGVPYGDFSSTDQYVPGKPAIYRVEAHIDSSSKIVPCIPCRSDHGLLWPLGTFETWITSVEYDHAIKRGYTFKVLEAFVWDTLVYPFAAFTQKCEELERDPELKEVAKLMRNSVYGKFGTALTSKDFYIGENAPDGYEMAIDEETGRCCTTLHVKTQNSDSVFIMPVWAAFITANQRVWLFQTIQAVGDENVVYCDTDSVKAKKESVLAAVARGEITIHPKAYGACKVDEEYSWFQCLGPKVYHGVLIDGKSKQRAKGLKKSQLNEDYYEEIYSLIIQSQENNLNKEEIERARANMKKMKIDGTRNAMAMLKNRGKEIAVSRQRRITDIRNSETWKLNGTVIQPPILEIEKKKEEKENKFTLPNLLNKG